MDSPSCGINTTLDFGSSFELTACMEIKSATTEQMNAIVRQCAVHGKGLFMASLQYALAKRHIKMFYGAHDLIAELDGKTPTGELLSGARARNSDTALNAW